MADKEVQVSVYDPARNAKYSVPVSTAILYIKEAKKLEKIMLSKGLIEKEVE
jgi:hypothetical protein